jgi:hypothetical protein
MGTAQVSVVPVFFGSIPLHRAHSACTTKVVIGLDPDPALALALLLIKIKSRIRIKRGQKPWWLG